MRHARQNPKKYLLRDAPVPADTLPIAVVDSSAAQAAASPPGEEEDEFRMEPPPVSTAPTVVQPALPSRTEEELPSSSPTALQSGVEIDV